MRGFHRILDTQDTGFTHDRNRRQEYITAARPTRLNYDAYY